MSVTLVYEDCFCGFWKKGIHMSEPQRKTLTRTTIGPYRAISRGEDQNGGEQPVIVGLDNILDPRMGVIDERGRMSCEGDHAQCFGRMG